MVTQERPQSRFRLDSRDLPYLGFILLAIVLVYWDVFFLRQAFLSGDHLIQHYPWAKFLQDSIRQGRLPWWTSQIQCGFPLLAEGQIGAFYLPNLIFLFLLPLRWAYNYEVLFHFALGAFFFYYYVRHLGLSREAGLFSSLIFLFGSTEGGFYYNLTSQRVAVWFPLTLVLADGLAGQDRRGALKQAFLLAMVFALQIFAGYLQIAIYCIGFTTLYWLLRLSPAFAKEGESERRQIKTAVAAYAVAIGLALIISIVQWYPTLRLSAFSARAAAIEALAYIGSPNPLFLMTLLFPDWAGMWGAGIYVGIVGLFFVFWSVYDRPGRTEKLWRLAFILSLLLSLGKFSPLYQIIVKLFRVYFFRIPTKFLFFTSFALCVLSAYGLDKFLRKTALRSSVLKKTRRVFFGAWLLILAGIATGNVVTRVFKKPLLGVLESYVTQKIYGQPYHPHSLETYREKLYGYYEYLLYLTSPSADQTLVPVLLFIGQVGAGALLIRGKEPRKAFPWICLLLFSDLFLYAHLNTRRDLNPFVIVEPRSKLVEQVGQDKGRFRIHEFNTNPLRSGLFPIVPDQNMLDGLEDIGVYSPFAFADYKRFLGELGGVDDSLYQIKAQVKDWKTQERILDHLNVKYIFLNSTTELKGLEFLAEENGIRLYQNKRYWPRAFFIDHAEALSRIETPREVPILEWKEGREVFDTRGLGRGILVVSEQNYEGWKARIGTQLTKPEALAPCLKGVRLEVPVDRVELSYEEKHQGILLTLFGLGLLIAVAGLGIRI